MYVYNYMFSQETMPTKADKEDIEELRRKAQGRCYSGIIFILHFLCGW